MGKRTSGFTLIELVIVIVILGILAATAIPKFVDLSSDAETAVVQATAGAIKSAAVITFAQTKTANVWASIMNNTDIDPAITVGACAIDPNGDCKATITTGGSGSVDVVVEASLCSGC